MGEISRESRSDSRNGSRPLIKRESTGKGRIVLNVALVEVAYIRNGFLTGVNTAMNPTTILRTRRKVK